MTTFDLRSAMQDRGISFGVEELLLHDRGIQEAIARKDLVIDPFPEDEQFQPASLDVKIGMVKIYDRKARNKTIEVSEETRNKALSKLKKKAKRKGKESDDEESNDKEGISKKASQEAEPMI